MDDQNPHAPEAAHGGTTFEKRRLNLNVSIDLDDQLTWKELFWFVDLAKRTGVHPDNAVSLRFNENDRCYDGLSLYVEPEQLNEL